MGDPVADLREAAAAREELRERADALAGDLDRVADAYERVAGILDRYEERATDWDDPQGYVEFRDALEDAVADLPDGMPARDGFEAASDALETSGLTDTLSAGDFERAREALDPAREYADLRESLSAVRRRHREARRDVRGRLEDLEARIASLERLERLGRADLDAPVERLREPVEAYNDAVSDAFLDFKRGAGAREVLGFVADAGAYPLVPFRPVPEALRSYVERADAGTEPILTLLEYAEYSISKLDHYVESPRALKSAVATNRTYLRGLDAGPLTVDWPPPPADRLRWRAREVEAAVRRFAPEDVLARLRAVRGLVREPGTYERLRESAHARAEMGPDERERVASGEVAAELRDRREERDRLAEALETHA